VSVSVIRIETEVKTTKKSLVARNTITGVVVTMPSTKRATGVVSHIGSTRSGRKTTLQHEKKKIGNIVGLRSIMRERMGRREKERRTEIKKLGSGMMCQGEKAETGAPQYEGRRELAMKERRRKRDMKILQRVAKSS